MAFAFTTSGAVKLAAGIETSDTSITNAQYEDWSDKVENIICDIVRFNVIDNYSNLTDDGKRILGDLEDSMIAQKIIKFKWNDYIGSKAGNILNVSENDIRRLTNMLEENKIKTYLGIT